MNTKLHGLIDTEDRPIRFFVTAGQVSDYTDAAALLGNFRVVFNEPVERFESTNDTLENSGF